MNCEAHFLQGSEGAARRSGTHTVQQREMCESEFQTRRGPEGEEFSSHSQTVRAHPHSPAREQHCLICSPVLDLHSTLLLSLSFLISALHTSLLPKSHAPLCASCSPFPSYHTACISILVLPLYLCISNAYEGLYLFS